MDVQQKEQNPASAGLNVPFRAQPSGYQHKGL